MRALKYLIAGVFYLFTAEVFSHEIAKIVLEEPVDSGTSSGIGNIRGWVISGSGVDRVELFVNGQYQADIPFGGQRKDVESAYPNVPNSIKSGFGQTFNFGELGYGQHRITVRAYLGDGLLIEDTAYFKASVLPEPFFPESEKPDLSEASISLDKATGEIRIAKVDLTSGERLDLRLKWSTAEQGFALVDVTNFEFPSADECDGSDGAVHIDCFGGDLPDDNYYSFSGEENCEVIGYDPVPSQAVLLECDDREGMTTLSDICPTGPVIYKDPSFWYEKCNLDGTVREGA